ncbi:MAG: DNA repair protein RecO [Alphaproteobacteria bacterium]|nr:DNA repair protein RecO [Alphaproteobacteria bacterium]
MQISDEGYIIKLLKHGENSLIITVLSDAHGKLTGFVKGGGGKKKSGIYQLGNKISFNAYARLPENMPQFKGVELLQSKLAHLLQHPQKLAVMQAFCALFDAVLPEGEVLEGLIAPLQHFMNALQDDTWLQHYAVLEFKLLYFLGIGLDLGSCAATGTIENLAFVSPKSGRAVCFEAGLPYQNKLFKYPHFALSKNIVPSNEDIFDLLKMNAFFLKKNFFDAHGLQFPNCRANLQDILH